MPSWLTFVIPLALAVASFYFGVRWERGEQAQTTLETKAHVEETAAQEREIADEKGLIHADATNTLQAELDEARRKLATHTSGRQCLPAAAVGVLNATGYVPGRAADAAPAAEPASAPAAAATDSDVAESIVACRTGYSRLADQLNQILDIEEARPH